VMWSVVIDKLQITESYDEWCIARSL